MSGFIPLFDKISFHEEGGEPDSPAWLYRWNHSYVSPLAMAEFPPPSNLPTLKWGLMVAERLLNSLVNAIEVEASSKEMDEFKAKAKDLKELVEQKKLNFRTLKAVVADTVQFGRLKDNDERPESIEDYAELFRTIQLPAVASDYNLDSTFAMMRVAGPNPLMIELMTEPIPNFPVTEAHYRAVMGDEDTMEAAMAEHRLYVCDYQALDGFEQPTTEPTKYPYAPIALFAETKDTRTLTPVAIQTQQKPGPDNPICIADGSYDWLIAKTIIENADGNFHELVSHLGRTHLYMEPFVVSTGRNLPLDHPIAKLLWPHFEGTLFINFSARVALISPGGLVEQLHNATLDSMLALTGKDVSGYPFNGSFLPKTFEKRRVENLKDYPYRDDSLLYWKAIHQWAKAYVDDAYASDEAVASDKALQKWHADLVSVDGGRIRDFGELGAISTKRYLSQALTMIIFTSSVQHAAVNFPQFDLMSYCPNLPLSIYQPFRTGADAQQYLDCLPPLNKAQLQQWLFYQLGTLHYTQLGEYNDGYFSQQLEKGPLAAFQKELLNVGQTIETRNLKRRPYNTLLPNGIPQSINI